MDRTDSSTSNVHAHQRARKEMLRLGIDGPVTGIRRLSYARAQVRLQSGHIVEVTGRLAANLIEMLKAA
jgi:hypothetical protein